MTKAGRIVLSVTASGSLVLMRGFPEYLAGRGWEVHLVCSDPQGMIPSSPGVEVHHVPMSRQPSPKADLHALRIWIDLLKRIQPDVISAGTPKAGLLGMVASKAVGVPRRIYHLRGLRLEGSSGPSYALLWSLERLAAQCATDVLAVSESLKLEFSRKKLAHSGKIKVLGRGSSNGVDVDRFRPDSSSTSNQLELKQSLGLDPSLPVVGYVGRLTKDKGVGDLAAASRKLHDKGVPHQLLVVGGVDDASGSPWTAAGLTPQQHPKVTGHVADTAPYYQVMDVLTLPTRREGFPNVVLEAGASGVPVITTVVTGAKDSVIHRQTGLLVSPGQPQVLASALEEILGNTKFSRKLAKNARSLIEQDYRREEVWRLLDNYYSGV